MTKASAQEKSSEWRDLATLKAEGESDPSGLDPSRLGLREGKNVGGTEVKAWAPAQWGGHPGSGCMMMGSVFRTSGLRNCACVQGWGAGRGAGGEGRPSSRRCQEKLDVLASNPAPHMGGDHIWGHRHWTPRGWTHGSGTQTARSPKGEVSAMSDSVGRQAR